MRFHFISLFITLLSFGCSPTPPSNNTEVIIVGQMKDAMWKGEIYGKIDLDTIADKQHLYGLGPLEGLAGEVLILDGKSYLSRVLADSSIRIVESFLAKAPFFAYAHVDRWQELAVPDSVQNLKSLEVFLDALPGSKSEPTFFKLSAVVNQAGIHIVNLPKGSTVSSPEEAHAGKQGYIIENEACEILGFYSTQHQSIFTHHDTHLHMHLITADRMKMGHLDAAQFQEGSLKLYLPLE